MAGIGTQSVPACDPPPETQVVPIIVWSVFGRRDPPGDARYERLFAARKSGHLKKVKYTGLTPMDPAGVRSNT